MGQTSQGLSFFYHQTLANGGFFLDNSADIFRIPDKANPLIQFVFGVFSEEQNCLETAPFSNFCVVFVANISWFQVRLGAKEMQIHRPLLPVPRLEGNGYSRVGNMLGLSGRLWVPQMAMNWQLLRMIQNLPFANACSPMILGFITRFVADGPRVKKKT